MLVYQRVVHVQCQMELGWRVNFNMFCADGMIRTPVPTTILYRLYIIINLHSSICHITLKNLP